MMKLIKNLNSSAKQQLEASEEEWVNPKNH